MKFRFPDLVIVQGFLDKSRSRKPSGLVAYLLDPWMQVRTIRPFCLLLLTIYMGWDVQT